MSKIKTGLLVFILLGTALPSQAQWMRKERSKGRLISYNSIGIQAGAMMYFGDLNPLAQYISTDITSTRPSLGLTFNHRFNSRLTGRIGFNWGRLFADDFKAANPEDERHRFRYVRNQHFRNDIYELNAMFEFDLFPTLARNRYYKSLNRIPFTPYLVAGIAGFYHNPQAKTPANWSGPEGAAQWVALQPLSTEGQGLTRGSDGTSYEKAYSRLQIAIPLGAGVRFKLSNRTHLAFEVIYRYLFTDYIDDTGGNYADPRDLSSDLSRAMANRTLEPVAAFKGETRLPVDQVISNVLINDSFGNPTVSGFGNDGDKRGEGNEDIYLFAGFHLTYIIGRDDDVWCTNGRSRRKR
ncbi:MAG: hypothetical protein HC913_03590 [Microscillaceae bacterium]|nr:hypothetical protein [Microscillaceae bacterium]